MRYLRALYRLLAFAGITFFYLWVVVIGSWLGGDKLKRSFKNRARWSAKVLATLGIEVEVKGTVPSGGYLFVANHRSYIDICVILKFVLASIVAKAEVAQWPLIGAGARATYTVMIKREDADSRKNTRIQVQRLLESGYSVVIFPEGTTFEGPGILPFRPGPFQIAENSKFNLLPIAVEYLHPEDAWVGNDTFIGHFLKCFGKPKTKVTLSFGSTIAPGPWQQTHDTAQAWIEKETKHIRQQYNHG